MPVITADIRLDIQQIKEAIQQLPSKKKIQLAEELDKETWAKRFTKLVATIRRRAKKSKITEKEIRRACERVRQRIYNEQTKSRH